MLVTDKLQRESWKIWRPCELTVSQDGEVPLPSKKTLNRRFNLLYPIECSNETKTKICEKSVENRSTASIRSMTYKDQSVTESKNELDVREPLKTRPKQFGRTKGKKQDQRLVKFVTTLLVVGVSWEYLFHNVMSISNKYIYVYGYLYNFISLNNFLVTSLYVLFCQVKVICSCFIHFPFLS